MLVLYQEIEHLLIQLILKKYLDVEYHQTAYKGIVYIVPGQLAPTLVHLSRKDIETNARRKVEMVVAKGASKPRKRTRTAVEKDASGSSVLRKRKRGAGGNGKGREDDDDGDDEEDEDGEEDDWAGPGPGPSRNLFSPTALEAVMDDDEDDEDEDYDWSRSMREDPPRKRHKGRRKSENGFVMIKEGDNEIMVLSSD
jgi:ATP-dependent DNA helicase Q1